MRTTFIFLCHSICFRAVDHLSEVCILFADLVGFTKASAEHHPNFLIGLFLRDVFLEFDRCVEKHGLEKIKTIGKRGICCLPYNTTSPPNLRVSGPFFDR